MKILAKEAAQYQNAVTPPANSPTINKPVQQTSRNYYDRASNTWKPWAGSQYESAAKKNQQKPVTSPDGKHMWGDGISYHNTGKKDANGQALFEGNMIHSTEAPLWVQHPIDKSQGFSNWGEGLLAKYRKRT
jgi:hypothetical protein